VDRNSERDDGAECARRVAGERLLVRSHGGGADGEAARGGVLHDRAAGTSFTGERVGGEECALEVEQVVERQLLAAPLDERAEAGAARLDVERGALVWVLAVAERLRA